MAKGVFPSPFADEDLSQVFRKGRTNMEVGSDGGNKGRGGDVCAQRQQPRKPFREKKTERRGASEAPRSLPW